jgi:hypothetical protein
MRRAIGVCGVVALALVAAGCGGGGSSDDAGGAMSSAAERDATSVVDGRDGTEATDASTAATDAEAGDSAGRDVDPALVELVDVDRELDAWQELLAAVGPDEQVPLDVARQAFELTIGDLPGVEVGPGPVQVTSGSAALRWLSVHWEALTDEQRTAVGVALGRPEGPSKGAGAAVPTGAGQTGAEVACSTPQYSIDRDGDGAQPYRALVDEEVAKLAGALGRPLGIPVHVEVGVAPAGSVTKAWASPQSTDCVGSAATSCWVHLNTDQLAGEPEQVQRHAVSHELVHCFQATYVPVATYQTRPDWLAEGFAEFASNQLNPGGPRYSFQEYTQAPSTPLFARRYDAVGFFFHLWSVGADVYGQYPQAFVADSSLVAFERLVVASGSGFDDTWASALALDVDRGTAWDMPEAPADAEPGYGSAVLVDGGRILLDAGVATTRLGHVDFDAEVVRFTVGGSRHGRVGWDQGGDVLLAELDGQEYCRAPGGCTCPSGTGGSPPQTVIPSEGAIVSAAGSTQPTTVEITGVSLDEYCEPGLAGTVPAADGLDPCVVGTWVSDAFDVPGPIGGSGGAGARVTIAADGSGRWEFDGMAPIVQTDDQIGVTRELRASGVGTGRVVTAGGSWSVADLDVSAAPAVLVDPIAGEIELPGGPGLYVGMAPGTYACAGDVIEYVTPDPIEGGPIAVTLRRV